MNNILIFIFCFFAMSSYSFAFGNFVGKSKVKNSNIAYSQQSQCESAESEICLDISGKDMRRYKAGLVDDLSKPKFIKKDISVCTDRASCTPLLAALDCSVHAAGSFPVMVEDFSEVYCAEPNGFEQKDVLIADAAGIVAADIADLQSASDKVLRESKKLSRSVELGQCVQDSKGTMTPVQQTFCIAALIRELLGNGVAPGDL